MSFMRTDGSLWGAIPQTHGNVYWVSPGDTYTVEGRTYSASDDHDGLAPERALRTVNKAIDDLVIADGGDVVVLLPGSHLPQDSSGGAASIAIDTAGVTLMGLPAGAGNHLGQSSIIASVAGLPNFTVTASNVEIAYLNIIAGTGRDCITVTSPGSGLHVHHCFFDMFNATVDAATRGVVTGVNTSGHLIEDCHFISDGAQGPAIAVGAAMDVLIRRCTFVATAGTWGVAVTQNSIASPGLIVRDCVFHAGDATISDGIRGITGMAAAAMLAIGNIFADSVTKAVDDYDANDAELSLNYTSGLGSGDGGVKVEAIT